MNKKCILFVRVSTQVQNFDEQERELYQMAQRDGYSKDNIIPIAEIESGRKLKEEERKGINAMKKYIEEDSSIDCVYLWEISRLARKQKVLFSVRDYLVDRNINIKIKTPSCTLLNDNGTINEGGDMLFSLYAQMSEAEMRTKIERFKRTKKINSEKMKYSGGKIMYGYEVDNNGYYQINEDEAKVIRLIYDLYTNNNIGTMRLTKELQERGYFLKGSFVLKILKNTAYIGYCNYPKGNTRKYPPIITEEIYNKAQEQKQKNKLNSDKSRKHIWLCSKLIRCYECGGYLMANAGAGTYSCKSHTHQNFYKKNCSNKTSINIEVMDGIAWHYTKSLYIKDTLEDINKQITNCKNQIEVLNNKINAGVEIEKKIEEREKRLKEGYYDHADIDEKEYIERKKKLNKDRKNFEIKQAEYKNDIVRLNNVIQTLEKDKKDKTVVNRLKETLNLYNQEIPRENKYEIIHRYIKMIEIREATLFHHCNECEESLNKEKISQNDKKKNAREVIIYGINGDIYTYYFLFNEKSHWRKYAKLDKNTNKIHFIGMIIRQ